MSSASASTSAPISDLSVVGSGSSVLLPIPPSIKVTPRAIYVGDPKQLVDLLVSKVATAILEITRTKGNQPLYKLKLRCKTLFAGNIEVFFLLDYPNQKLLPSTNYKGDPEIVCRMSREASEVIALDKERALTYLSNLDLALNFWSLKMEEEVKKVYPDKTPVQVDKFSRDGLLELKINSFVKDFTLDKFLHTCDSKSATPCFHVSYGWITGTEDPRSSDQTWGYKFELSPFPQYPPSTRSRKPAVSASERQETLMKKRKTEEAVASTQDEENLC